MTKNLSIKTYLACLILIILNGCASKSLLQPNVSTQLSPSAKTYLQQATAAQGTKQQNYQLLAIKQLLKNNDTNNAQQLLAQLQQAPLNDNLNTQRIILLAQLKLKENRPRDALKILHSIHNIKTYPTDIQTDYFSTSAEAYLRNHNISYSTLARISLNSLIQDQQLKQQNQTIIWHNLQRISPAKLNQLLQRSTAPNLRGWITLVLLSKTPPASPQALIDNIKSWQKSYPQHAANQLLPNDDTLNKLLQIHIPNQIALLLPLHGEFDKMGQAIRDGFMTAYYNSLKKLSTSPKIKIYDTSQTNDIVALYQQAVTDGAQFIVGPLTKTNVEALIQHGDLTVPTLTLNYLPNDQDAPNNLIQFGLSPERSAQQTAELARQYGTNRILTISPEGDWGNRVVTAFVAKWKQLNGQLTDSFSFSTAPTENMAHDIAAILKVDQSQYRAKTLETLFGERLKAIPRRRQDIDGIFLLATPFQARQIRPLLSFYYADNLPVFSIANIYQGFPEPRKDHDLNGIYFTDMPWLLAKSNYINNLKQAIKASWPANFKINNRLYALGIDAYTLSIMTQQLMILPNFPIRGVTGQLYLTDKQCVYQQLLWTQFKNGQPKVIE